MGWHMNKLDASKVSYLSMCRLYNVLTEWNDERSNTEIHAFCEPNGDKKTIEKQINFNRYSNFNKTSASDHAFKLFIHSNQERMNKISNDSMIHYLSDNVASFCGVYVWSKNYKFANP